MKKIIIFCILIISELSLYSQSIEKLGIIQDIHFVDGIAGGPGSPNELSVNEVDEQIKIINKYSDFTYYDMHNLKGISKEKYRSAFTTAQVELGNYDISFYDEIVRVENGKLVKQVSGGHETKSGISFILKKDSGYIVYYVNERGIPGAVDTKGKIYGNVEAIEYLKKYDPEKYEHPKTARVVALADDMISIVGTPETLDPPFLFEDSGINKIGNKYYYSYCSNFADRSKSNDKDKMPTGVICYMTSDSPLGPYTYQGYTLENPGTYYGTGGNNHHWIFQFKNKWYIAYHAGTAEKVVGLEKGGYRSLFINDFEMNADGSFPIQKAGKAGVEQVGSFNPYETVPAATFHSARNAAVTDKQTIASIKDGAYLCIKGVDFSDGAKEVALTVVPGAKGNVKICIDHFGGNGTVLGEAAVENKETVTAKLNTTTGKHDLYIVMSEGVELINWQIK